MRNRVTKLQHEKKTGSVFAVEEEWTRTDEGHTLNEWYLYPSTGVDPTTGLPLWYTDASRTQTTTDFTKTQRIWMGASAIPILTGGFNLHADWKGVYMDVNAVWFAEHKIMNSYSGDFYSDDARLLQSGRGVDDMYGKTWQGMGDNKAQFPILSTDNSHTGGIASASDQYLRRGDFIRLRDLTLGYNFSKSLLTRLHFTGTIAVYAQVTNLFTYKFDKKPNYAPEIPENGLWEFRNPAMRTFSIGCSVNF